jgi:hypothetical protein
LGLGRKGCDGRPHGNWVSTLSSEGVIIREAIPISISKYCSPHMNIFILSDISLMDTKNTKIVATNENKRSCHGFYFGKGRGAFS